MTLQHASKNLKNRPTSFRDIRGQSWGHDGASRLQPAIVAVLRPMIINLHGPVENTCAYSLVLTVSF
jgi:hypothetical protein